MSEAELRSMVREILREALAQRRPGGGQATAAAGAAPAAEPVRIASDDDLAAFVRRLAALMDDPAAAAAVRAGRHRFTLAGGPPAPARPATVAGPAVAVLEGAVTEAKVSRLKNVAAVRLAPGAVLTPLARDRLRALGIAIEGRR